MEQRGPAPSLWLFLLLHHCFSNFKCRFLATPLKFLILGLGWGLRMWISNKFPGILMPLPKDHVGRMLYWAHCCHIPRAKVTWQPSLALGVSDLPTYYCYWNTVMKSKTGENLWCPLIPCLISAPWGHLHMQTWATDFERHYSQEPKRKILLHIKNKGSKHFFSADLPEKWKALDLEDVFLFSTDLSDH
jgi:hypothetical protein